MNITTITLTLNILLLTLFTAIIIRASLKGIEIVASRLFLGRTEATIDILTLITAVALNTYQAWQTNPILPVITTTAATITLIAYRQIEKKALNNPKHIETLINLLEKERQKLKKQYLRLLIKNDYGKI